MSNGSLTKIGTADKAPSQTPSGNNSAIVGAGSSSSGNGVSPANASMSSTDQNRKRSMGSTALGGMQASPISFQGNGTDDLSGLFSPSIFANASRSNSSDYAFPVVDKPTPPGTKQSGAETSSASNVTSHKHRASSTSITASPSVSSISHAGMDSSCGTTPEPTANSPEQHKPTESTLNTINEESGPRNNVKDRNSFCDEWATACGNTANPVPRSTSQATSAPEPPSSVISSPGTGINGINIMAQQNGGQFDPVLFGDYRDTQNELFNNDFFSDSFWNQDYSTPFNMPVELSPLPKKDLMQQVEEQQNAGDNEIVPGEDPKQYMTCDKLWLVSLPQ